ncbi:MAG: homogentisate 1,2-dioxygenase, partial [Sneathiella sp.]
MSHAYLSGFGNEFESEAKPGALPVGQNNPQKCPYGLYAEQISGTAFTAPNAHNFRSWTYRMRPSVRHMPRFGNIRYPDWTSAGVGERVEAPLGQFRWGPVTVPKVPTQFPASIATMTTAGDVQT